MVSELVCDELVPPGELLAGEAEQDAVHRAEVVQVTRVVHLLVQLHVEGNLEQLFIIDVILLSGHRVCHVIFRSDLTELFVTSVNAPLHQRVAESENSFFMVSLPPKKGTIGQIT